MLKLRISFFTHLLLMVVQVCCFVFPSRLDASSLRGYDQGTSIFYILRCIDFNTKQTFDVYRYVCKNCSYTVSKPQEMTYHPWSEECIFMARRKRIKSN